MISSLEYSEVKLVNEIIRKLYDSEVPLHNRIINFLNDTMSVIYFDRATILFFYRGEDDLYYKHSSISLNWENDVETVKTYDNYYCHEDDTLPVFDQPSPILFRSNAFFDQKARRKNRYWTEYLIPNNCIHSLEGNLQIKNSHGLKGAFNLYRGEEKSDFSDKDMAIMALLQPHLSNALKFYGEQADTTSIFFMLENYNCVGVAMLDNTCQLLRSNSTYRTFVEDEKLGAVISEKVTNLCIQLASKANTSDATSLEYKFEDAPIFIEVSKFFAGRASDTAKYTCMVYDLSHFISKTLNQAKEKYTLTPREFDILQEILKGKSNEEIAAELYLSLPTVKKYLASIYSKMEIKSQKQIFEKLKLQ